MFPGTPSIPTPHREPDLTTSPGSPSSIAVPAAGGSPAPPASDPWIAINSIRALSMDAVEQANSGHPGTPMALAPVAWVLWTRHLRHHPGAPDWPDRDRFVLSCGHASMLLYALHYLSGYGLTLDDIRGFRQWGSRTPGHPERWHSPGVETTTGPLGQGVGNAVGMAVAERLLADRFNRGEHLVVDHRTWALVSDGDLMEGVASEAASLAGHLRLHKLTLIYDDNRITIDGATDLSFSEDVGARFAAYGWSVHRVADGNDLEAMDRALGEAAASDRPALVIVRTVIGDPAPTKRDRSEAHGAPLGADEVARTRDLIGWPPEPFHVPDQALTDGRRCLDRGAAWEAEWRERRAAWQRAHPDLAAEFDRALAGELADGWDSALPVPDGKPLATRQASAKVLEALVRSVPELAGGSADLAGSTGVNVSHGGAFSAGSAGRTLHWGIREHAMAAAMNGMAGHGGVRPYGSTFLVFADYMKPSIRLAALMGLPTVYVFTHDSIGVGEDGPTHQPVEQLAMLRAIPGMTVWRPADLGETIAAWRDAVQRRSGPTALVFTRQKVPGLGAGAFGDPSRGGYVLHDPPGSPDAVLIATGSEVSLAHAAAIALGEAGVGVRVVSLPSWERFDAQPAEYRESVLPTGLRARVAVEAGTSFGWHRWTGDRGTTVTMDRFGASAPGERLFEEFGFTVERVVAAVRSVLEKGSAS